ncbi:hypothetical protein SAZ11_25665 [Streptomyces sp. FXJ1.4098]|uniref:hypothetical protein n=1 Tax=Streptomyces sp. NPDC020845 TaxID=3365096 RepID=UPI002991E580|nr:hypothetical protein [Streptomyces sp. FXJ1.4098]
MIKAVRIAGAAAAAALLLTGCGSDSDGGDSKSDPSKKAPASEQSSAPAEGGAGGAVSGAYMSKSGGEAMILSISGEKAALIAGKHQCSGEYADMGNKMLMLKCADGNTDRTMGKVTASADGKTLKVSWDAGMNDTFTKVTTPADIPTNIPTDIPGLESVGGITGG